MLVQHGSEIREATASYRSGSVRYMNILVWARFCSIGGIEPRTDGRILQGVLVAACANGLDGMRKGCKVVDKPGTIVVILH